MAPADVEMTDASSPPADIPMFPTIRILEIVKEAQLQHGLRHGDYYRYRTYCASKLYRMRKATNFQNSHKGKIRHKAKFQKKWITEDAFHDERLIQIGIFEAEKSWAQAMFDKQILEDNAEKLRKKFSMRMNLKRAVHHAKEMESLIRNSFRCDAPTKLEAQAYAAWLLGICYFEQRQWKAAGEALKTARSVYEGLAEATPNTSLVNIYKAKCREIHPQLRLCDFNSSESSVASMSDLMSLRLQLGGGEGLDNLIAEMRAKASTDANVIVEWGGDRSTVDDDKIKQVIHGWNQTDSELKQCENAKERMALYEKQLMDTRDAIDKVNDNIRRKTATNADVSGLRTVKSYLEYLKISGTAAKYLAIIENSKVEKKAKPQDLLRLYDSVIENLKEVLEIPGAERSNDLIAAYNARIAFYRAFRCHHMAIAYASQNKFAEAFALFNRAGQRKNEAEKLAKAIKENKFFNEDAKELDGLVKMIEVDREAARNRQLTDATLLDEVKIELLDSKITLLENKSHWCISSIQGNLAKQNEIPVTQVPPTFSSMPNKPLFFDLALNHVSIPMDDLQKRLDKANEGSKPQSKKEKTVGGKNAPTTEEQQSGISGMVKGWFWGKS